ncbi:hypothetical protein AX14_011789 [Amanita brunnescens Koide BX004]|nr:hypothetical protein AX14_011789 [Amanita brunnescens Koide BX004]
MAWGRTLDSSAQILTPVCRPLDSWRYISYYWKENSKEQVLSVILPRPAGTTITPSSSSVLPNPPSSWLAEVQNVHLRRSTVAGLYERLKRYLFIQVRGTPASGKTVLARLLGTHISQQDPGVHVIWIQGWTQRVAESRDYQSYLQDRGWVINRETVFIFDEAQATYRDDALWHHFFKSMETFNARLIVFCSYGSPSLPIDVGDTMEIPTPISVPDHQRVTLRHVGHDDDLPPVGLFFTQSEFNDLVKNQKSYYDESFFDAVFRITNGHVGALHDFCKIVTNDGSFREFKHAGKLYTWDSFLSSFTPENLLRRLGYTGVFSRGLPPDEVLQSSAMASVFSAVLSKNVVTEADFETGSEKSDALQQCFCNGWLHADKFVTNLQVTSSHHRFTACMYSGNYGAMSPKKIWSHSMQIVFWNL